MKTSISYVLEGFGYRKNPLFFWQASNCLRISRHDFCLFAETEKSGLKIHDSLFFFGTRKQMNVSGNLNNNIIWGRDGMISFSNERNENRITL